MRYLNHQILKIDIFCRTQHLASSIKLKLQMDKYKNYFLSKLDSVLSNLSDTEKDTISYYKLIIMVEVQVATPQVWALVDNGGLYSFNFRVKNFYYFI